MAGEVPGHRFYRVLCAWGYTLLQGHRQRRPSFSPPLPNALSWTFAAWKRLGGFCRLLRLIRAARPKACYLADLHSSCSVSAGHRLRPPVTDAGRGRSRRMARVWHLRMAASITSVAVFPVASQSFSSSRMVSSSSRYVFFTFIRVWLPSGFLYGTYRFWRSSNEAVFKYSFITYVPLSQRHRNHSSRSFPRKA